MTTQCSLALLESALAGNLPADDEAALHQHLEECQPCGAALERMAGGPAWCQEAAALLAEDELDAALPAHSLAGRGEWSEIDFTVEHLEPADEPGVLGRLGGYDVLEIIGRGGMGVVLKAFDPELKRCVAIKVLSPHLAASSLARKRFEREARAIAAVVHPHVLAIHQVQAAGRLPFLVMPLVAGESLAQRLTAQGRLELKEILRIGMQAAAGLSAAHEQGLVHRDVKPANILLEKGVERAVLTDFGLARAADDVSMTRWGIIAGTPQYMSPEQARGEALDCRSDLFSLGCVLYEMATGVSPFRTDSTLATLRRLVDDAPQSMLALNPELPPWFVGIVERLLEKDPSKRFASAKEVSELLEGCLAHLQQPASVPLPNVLIMLRRDEKTSRRSVMSTGSRKPPLKRTLLMLTLLGISLFAVGVATTNPPDISGQWQSPDWGQVVLKQTAPGEYAGSYTDTVGKGPGRIELKWSRIERRFNGTWSEGEDRFGDLSVRLVDKEIHGALTTDAKSKINPATPRLADLTWTRAGPSAAAAAAIPSPSEGKKATDAQSPKSLTFGSAAMMVIQKYSTSDKVLSGSLAVHDGEWVADVKSPQTLRLFERTDPCSEDCTVFYRAKLRTENFRGEVYLEMWCRLPGRGEFYSRGMNNTLAGSTDWVSCETPFFLKKGERPDLIRLNVVAQGTGVVEVKDVELLRTWNEKASGIPTRPSSEAGKVPGTVSESAAPELRFLAWQDENARALWGQSKKEDIKAWHGDGSPVKTNEDRTAILHNRPTLVNLRGVKDGDKARILDLWFSVRGAATSRLPRGVRISIKDDAGQVIPPFPNSVGAGGNGGSPDADGMSWFECQFAANVGVTLPPKGTVVLEYPGPWRARQTEVAPDFRGGIGVDQSSISVIGQSANGRAFVTIARGPEEAKNKLWDFRAESTDGKILEPVEAGGVAAIEQFEFDAPLSQIKMFRLGEREIKRIEFRNVALSPGQKTDVRVVVPDMPLPGSLPPDLNGRDAALPAEKANATHPRAIQFDGNHYAKVEPPPKFTSGDFTISLWFNPVRTAISAFPFMRNFAYHDRRGDIGLDLTMQGNLGFKAATGDNRWLFGWGPESRLNGPVRYVQWNHAVVTRRGDTYTMWMNGARAGSEKASANISDAENGNPFIVGGHMEESGEVGEMYRGDLDDFRILHRCLSDQEIVDLYKSSGDDTAMKGEGRVKLGPLCPGTVVVEVGRVHGETKYTLPPGPGLSLPLPPDHRAPRPSYPPGVTVQITGVGGPEGWWNADGSPMPNPPPPVSGEQPAPNQPMHRAFLVRVVNQTTASCGLICEVAQPGEINWRVPPGQQAGPGENVLLDFSAYLPEAPFFTTLRIGVSSGPWEDLSQNTYDDTGKEQRPAKNKEARLGAARETKDGLQIGSSDEMATAELRIVAVGKDGRLIEPQLNVSGDANERWLTATFPGLSRRQLKEIKLQHRPYAFVEFRNVATQPSDKTMSPAEAEYAKLPATTRKILAALQTPTAAEFARVPLTEVIDNLKEARQMEMLWDEKVLDHAKVDRTTPVTFKGRMTLQSDLECILGPIGLADVVTDEVLLITTAEEARRLLKQGAIDPSARRSPRGAVTAKRIAQALQSPTAPLEFVETPIQNVVEYLSDAHHIPIVIGLNAGQIDNIEPVTMNLRGVSLASGLRLLLRNAGLTYVDRGEYILITTPEKAAEIKSASSATTRWFSAGPAYNELNRILSSRGIRLSSYNHATDHYMEIMSESHAGSTIVLLFALDHVDKVAPAEFRDLLLPMPWAKIEAALRKGETVEATGNACERRILLLAAPTVPQLEELIRKTKLLSVAEAEKVAGTDSASGIAALPASAHTWTFGNGQKVEGEFVKEAHGQVVVLVDNRIFPIPIHKLSVADQIYVRQQIEAQRRATAQEEERTWKDIKGKAIQGRFMDIEKENVVLLVNGETRRFPFDKITADDQDYVRGEMTARGEGKKIPPRTRKQHAPPNSEEPAAAHSYFERGQAHDQNKQYADAAADYSRALESDPKDFAARFNRALVYESLREYDKAIADYTRVIEGDTDFSNNVESKDECLAMTHHYRGRAYQWYKHDNVKAVADFTAALRLDPKIEMVHYRRGRAYNALKEYAKAAADFTLALEHDPDYPNLLCACAWQLATCPDAKFRDGKKALELAKKGNQIFKWEVADQVETLAAANAETGQFEEAVKWQKKAIELSAAKAKAHPEDDKAMRQRLRLYEARKPYRAE